MKRRHVAVLVGAVALLVGLTVPVNASADGPTVNEMFTRRGPDEVSPSGHSVFADCQLNNAAAPEGWLDAWAQLVIDQEDGHSHVTIKVRKARPHTYFTVWLRLGGTDSSGNTFGGNPLTDGMATPLASSQTLPELLASTGAGNGNAQQPNGFTTNAAGNATFRTRVDFPIVAGAYPFQRFPGFDASDPRLPAAAPSIYPVAIAGPQGPYTLRVVSHCTDGVGHGLQSGPREWWFDWTVPS